MDYSKLSKVTDSLRKVKDAVDWSSKPKRDLIDPETDEPLWDEIDPRHDINIFGDEVESKEEADARYDELVELLEPFGWSGEGSRDDGGYLFSGEVPGFPSELLDKVNSWGEWVESVEFSDEEGECDPANALYLSINGAYVE